ncbi:urocanate hydratase, partial [Candidatus Bathyarchaeota archaeon]
EGILRSLENAIECGIKPEELIAYHCNGKVARNWDSYNKIVKALMELEDDETLIIQSGKPVLVTKTNRQVARVIHCNSLLLGKWDNPETFHKLEEEGLTMFGSISGAAWTWSFRGEELAPTYEVLKIVAREHYGGTLRGRMFLSAGLGGAGSAQPVACKLNEGVCLIVEADEARIRQRKEERVIDVTMDNLDEALDLAEKAVEKKEPLAIALLGNTGDVYPEMVKRGVTPDIVTDQTPYDRLPYGIIPAGLSPEEADVMRKEKPEEFIRRATENAMKVAKAMLQFKERGAVIYDYGTGLKALAISAGLEEASKIDFYGVYMRQNILKGRDFFRFAALSGDSVDIDKIDETVVRELASDKVIVNWVKSVREAPPPPKGLPERTYFLFHGQRRIARIINGMVRNGILKAPIILYRGCFTFVSSPQITAGIKDGSDGIADWTHLISILSAMVGADYIATTGLGSGDAVVSRWFVVLDGTKETDERLERLLRADAELTIARWADAGYEEPRRIAKELGVKMPSLSS